LLNNILSQLRDNPRLRWGIALIVGIVWLYALLLLRDDLQEQNLQYRTAGQVVGQLRVKLATPEWKARAVSARVLAVQLEGRLWQAPTSGLAQAGFQDWLNAALLEAGANRSQVTVTVLDEAIGSAPDQAEASDSTTPADLWKIRAKLGFDYTAPSLLAFLNAVENNDKRIMLGTLSVRKEPVPHVEMELYGYFQKQAVPSVKENKELVPL